MRPRFRAAAGLASLAALTAAGGAPAARAAEIARFPLPVGEINSVGRAGFTFGGPVVVGGTAVWMQRRDDGSWRVRSSAGGAPATIGSLARPQPGSFDTVAAVAGATRVVVTRLSFRPRGLPHDMDNVATGRDVLAGPPAGPLSVLDSWRGTGIGPDPACLQGGYPAPASIDGDAVAFRPCTPSSDPALRAVDLRTGVAGPRIPVADAPDAPWRLTGPYVSSEARVPRACPPATCFDNVVTVWRWRDGAPLGATTLPGYDADYRIGADGSVLPKPAGGFPPLPGPRLTRDPEEPSGLGPVPTRVLFSDAGTGRSVPVADVASYYDVPAGATDGTTAAFIAAPRCGVARVITTRVGAPPLRFSSPRPCGAIGTGSSAVLDRRGRMRFSVRCRPGCRGTLTADFGAIDGDQESCCYSRIGTIRLRSSARWRPIAMRAPVAARSIVKYPEIDSRAWVRIWFLDQDSRGAPVAVRTAQIPFPLPKVR